MTIASIPALFPVPKATLARFELFPKKSFGQNFLADYQLVERIAELAGPAPRHVVEIGAGLGGLTACLLLRGHTVTAIERDRDMLRVLRELFAQQTESGQLELVEADAKTVDLGALVPNEGPATLIGNLPYQITGPLLERTVHFKQRFTHSVYLVQREVADRMAAAPGSKTYGGLSVFCQAAFEVERAFLVRRGAFYPQPNVDSAVITLKRRDPALAEETEVFRQLVQRAFQERRKTLRNAWRGVCDVPLAELELMAQTAQVPLEARGETLDVQAFARMAEQISARGGE